ncbi:hypothetical protein ACOMHN_022980 [Nucella lapillus]
MGSFVSPQAKFSAAQTFPAPHSAVYLKERKRMYKLRYMQRLKQDPQRYEQHKEKQRRYYQSYYYKRKFEGRPL